VAASTNTTQGWSEDHSRHFIELGRVYTPSRDEIRDVMLSLIPAAIDEPFLAVELGVGGGWLSAAILERFPRARVLGLDGSPTMLRETAQLLAPFGVRFELRPFQLEDRSWLAAIGQDVRCFVSSLVIHHLDGHGKQQLYRDLFAHLDVGGGAILADLVAPRGEWERRSMARAWEAEVQRQSLAFTGSLDTYQQFVDDRWNLYEYPDPMDMPSTVPEHLQWLTEAGFGGANLFWLRAGHAVYGGYKAP
jgi:tRNA (cmo5U34)-methyltransferase